MTVDELINCLEREQLCASCVNEDSGCVACGCIYINAATLIKQQQSEIEQLKEICKTKTQFSNEKLDQLHELRKRNDELNQEIEQLKIIKSLADDQIKAQDNFIERLKANQPVKCSNDCVHFKKTIDEYPCKVCRNGYTSKFKRKESE